MKNKVQGFHYFKNVLDPLKCLEGAHPKNQLCGKLKLGHSSIWGIIHLWLSQALYIQMSLLNSFKLRTLKYCYI